MLQEKLRVPPLSNLDSMIFHKSYVGVIYMYYADECERKVCLISCFKIFVRSGALL